MKALLEYLVPIFAIYLPFQIALNPTSTIDLASSRVIALILLFLWLAHGLKRKKILISPSTVTFLLLSFLFFAVLSFFFAENQFWALRKLLFVFSLAPLYFVVSDTITGHAAKLRLIKALLVGGSLAALVGIIQFLSQFAFGIANVWQTWAGYLTVPFLGSSFSQAVLTHPSWAVSIAGKDYLRAFGLFPDPHMFSYYMGMLLPFSIALWIEKRGSGNFNIFFWSSLLLLSANLFSFSRGGYLALAAAMGIFGLHVLLESLLSRDKRRLKNLAVLIFILSLLLMTPVGKRFSASFDPHEGSNSGRLETWQSAMEVISENPLGVGIGNYAFVIKPSADYHEPIYAHSLYLDIAAETGLHSLLIWLALLAAIIAAFYKKGSMNGPMDLAAMFSIIIFSIHSLVETPLYSVHVFSLFLLIAALSSPTYDKTRN